MSMDNQFESATNAALARNQEWISVGEKLPDFVHTWNHDGDTYHESVELLVYDAKRGPQTGRRYASGWSTTLGDILHDVTHWMALPDPPSK